MDVRVNRVSVTPTPSAVKTLGMPHAVNSVMNAADAMSFQVKAEALKAVPAGELELEIAREVVGASLRPVTAGVMTDAPSSGTAAQVSVTIARLSLNARAGEEISATR